MTGSIPQSPCPRGARTVSLRPVRGGDTIRHLKKLEKGSGLNIYNLGTGNGYSVLDIVKNFESATGKKIPYVIKGRRAGDIATCYASAAKAEKELGWKAQFGIKEMCEDAWRWQSTNPNGYDN